MLLAIALPRANERGPQYTDQAIAAIHQGEQQRQSIVLEYGQHQGTVGLFCRCTTELSALVKSQFYAQCPNLSIAQISDDTFDAPAAHECWDADLRLRPDLLPIRRYPQFEDALNRTSADPLTAILATLSESKNSLLQCRVEIELRPARPRVRLHALKVMHRLARPFFRVHHRLAHAYAMLATSHRWAFRVTGWLLGRLARRSSHESHSNELITSSTLDVHH